MNRRAILILLLMAVTAIAHAQDTLYFDSNNNRVALVDLASSYRVYTMDNSREGNLIETTYSRSGTLKSACSLLLQFNKRVDIGLVDAYTLGQMPWHAPIIYQQIEFLKDGTYKEWYESGMLRKEIEYKEGEMNGHYISYWENGQIKREEQINGGKSVDGKCFDQSGKAIKYTPMEQMPVFPGGEARLFRFINNNIKIPTEMLQQNIQGRIIAQFTVEKDGSVADVKILHGLHPQGDKEVIRVLSLLGKWEPGISEDEPVSVKYTLPISFSSMDSNDPSGIQFNKGHF